jgi:LppX_LprAFG lipoprotein
LPQRRLLHLLGACSVLALFGCGLTAEERVTPAATPTPTELLEMASQRLTETPTIHFVLEVEGETFVDPLANMLLVRAEGDLQRPDRVSTVFQVEVVGRVVSLHLVSVGDEAWMTNLLTGEWEDAPREFTYRPGIIFSPRDGLGPVMERAQNVERLEDENISGRSAYHVRATVAQAIVRPLTYNTMKGSPITIDLWIDQETQDLLRARISEPPVSHRPHPAVWTLDFSHHGEAVTIEPPV